MRSTSECAFRCGLVLARDHLARSRAAAQRLRPADVDRLPSKPADTRIPYGTGSAPVRRACVCRKAAAPFRSPSSFTAAAGCRGSRRFRTRRRLPTRFATLASRPGTSNTGASDNPGGGWPGTFTDIADATDRVRIIAREHPIDLSRVVTDRSLRRSAPRAVGRRERPPPER